MLRLPFSLLALAVSPMWAASKPAIPNAVKDHYQPLALDQQKLAGIFGEHLRAAREGYLEKRGDESGGQFLDAAATAYEYSHDPNLKSVMDRVAKRVMASDSPADLPGLLGYYRVTGNEDAFAASKKIADRAFRNLNGEAGTSRENSAALLAPLVYLHRYVGDDRYLQLAKSIAASLTGSGRLNELPLRDALPAGRGLIELYRSTGDQSYYASAVELWSQIRDRHFSFGGGTAEIVDPCVTAGWMEVTLDLLRLTGGPQYAQELERTVYNGLFAAQDPKTGNTFSKIPLEGTKTPAGSDDVCGSSEAGAISVMPAAVWGRYGKGIGIMLYTAGRATFRLGRRGTVQLYSETSFPYTGEILLHVEPNRNSRFVLRLRVPQWTDSFVVDVGGTHLMGTPGGFVVLNRTWTRGDTVKIAIDMTVRTIGRTDGKPGIALQRGPQILALSKVMNPGIADLSDASLAAANPEGLQLAAVNTRFPASWAGEQAYKVDGEYAGKAQQFVLVPFADAVSYQVFLKPPGAGSGASAR